MRFDDVAVQGILQGRRVIGRSFFPGSKEIEIGIRLLTDRDIDLARFEAQMYLNKQCKKVDLSLSEFVNIDPESLDREHMRQVLLRAIVDPDSPPERPRPFFSNIEEVRALDSVMVQQLWVQYVDWQDAVNPRFKLTEEEVEQLAANLKDEPTAKVILAPFEHATLASLVRFLAARPST
jgi:hypothetical protein